MPTPTITVSQAKAAKVAGILYFLVALIAPIGLMYVPGKLIVTGDAAATAERIRSSEWLLRLGIGTELIPQIIGIFVVLALYRLFKPVDKNQAVLMVILGGLISIPIMSISVLNEIAALTLVGDANFLTVFSRSQLDALAYLFLRLHGQGLVLASIFWGLWLFPFGTLVIRSGFIPRVLGYLLMVAGVGYVASSFTTLLLPEYAELVGQIAMVLYFGELPIIFWLLIWGTRLKPSPSTSE
ncbi:MAG TPA: DUF4386 domain-containing protein [candidate division Zixibacteria bacterium]|nr:DUF4386 domain-containing protein [candidate division Zixibacteria bacterium]